MNCNNSSLFKLFKGFKTAFRGVGIAIRSERNLRLHFIIMFGVIFCGFFLRISMFEWLIVITMFGLVISFELLNTAVEKLCDVIEPNKDERIRTIKDISAAAVLWSAIMAFGVGLLIFLPKIISLL
ncbi:diacylglycerol kinase family protein [Lentimicrobium sp.]